MLIRDPERFDWRVMSDPGTAGSPFANGFYAIDKYSPFIFLIDEIYETEPDLTTVGDICPRIITTCKKYLGEDLSLWKFHYDSAAAWFAVDARKRFNLKYSPVYKKQGDKENRLALIEEFFLQRRFLISQNCPNAIWEFDNYFKDKNGNFIKKHDNHIDNTRYLCILTSLVLQPIDKPKDPTKKPKAKSSRSYSLDRDQKKVKDLDWRNRTFRKYES